MSKKLATRLADVEKKLTRSNSIQEIHIRGGLTPGVAIRASFAGHRLEGEPGETFEDFCVRARAAAHAVKAEVIIFGGLPPPPVEWAPPTGMEEALAKAAWSAADEMDR
jgi:hypothetical protein